MCPNWPISKILFRKLTFHSKKINITIIKVILHIQSVKEKRLQKKYLSDIKIVGHILTHQSTRAPVPNFERDSKFLFKKDVKTLRKEIRNSSQLTCIPKEFNYVKSIEIKAQRSFEKMGFLIIKPSRKKMNSVLTNHLHIYIRHLIIIDPR